MQQDHAEVPPADHGRVKIYERPGALAERSRRPLKIAVTLISVALASWLLFTCLA